MLFQTVCEKKRLMFFVLKSKIHNARQCVYWLRRQRARKNKVSQKIPREQFLDFCLQTQIERNDSLIATHRGLHYLRKTSYVAGVWNKGKEKVTCNLSVQCLCKQSFTLENISKGKDVKEDWELIDCGLKFHCKTNTWGNF